MKQRKTLMLLVLALTILFINCAKDDFQEVNGLCPKVIATSPIDGATNVPLNQKITATFNEEINAQTLTATSFTISGTSAIAGSIVYAGTVVTFTPNANLTPNTTYVGKITTYVKDLTGNALQEDFIWSFSTGATLQPIVVSTSPTNNETDVVVNKIVSATFNMPMSASSITASSFTLKQGTTPVAGSVTYSGNTAFFAPTATLNPNTIYTATITSNVQNSVGTALASNYVWTFTTGITVAPKVISTNPSMNQIGVPLNQIVTAVFDMPMNPITITSSTFTLKEGATPIAGTISYIGTTATFTPNADLSSNTNYTATITTGAKNNAGTPIAANYVWNFTTLNTANGPNLGTAAQFGAFGGNAGITNQGLNTVINNGGIGTTAASTLITGFHDATAIYTETPLNVGNVTGGIFTAPPMPGTATSFSIATQGLADATATYLSISPAALPGGTDPGAGELGGLTLAPGIYQSASGTFKITNGDLTLDAQGNPNALWIFQTAAGLTVGIAGPNGAKSVLMINGAQPKNVFWYVGSAATINAAGGGIMVGTIIANSGVTLSTAGNAAQTVLNGRAISLIASVTMVNTTINIP